MKKQSSRKSTKPPPARQSRASAPAPGSELHYKVVELSTVDEGSLERTANEWTKKGWRLDGVQFAMRESSKRPAMAFMFFTREGSAPASGSETEARDKLVRLAKEPTLEDDHRSSLAPSREEEPSGETSGALRWIELPEEREE